MSEKINHWCIICGTGYHACDSCESIKSFTPWRTITDTSRCYQIYLVIKQYNSGMVDKQGARCMLENIGVGMNDIKGFKADVRATLTEIFKEDKPVKAETKKADKPVAKDAKE